MKGRAVVPKNKEIEQNPSGNRHYSLEAIFFMACEKLSMSSGHDVNTHVKTMRHYAIETMRIMLEKRKLDEHLRTSMSRAILLHDFGKIFIDEKILCKKEPLTNSERQVIRQHPEMAHAVFRRTFMEDDAKAGILFHHERFDGNGYPKGLAGSSIPLVARIVSVIDAYEAMTHDRPYQKGVSRQKAIAEIKRSAGIPFDKRLTKKKEPEQQFDPAVVEAFIKVHRKRHPEVYK